MNHRQALCPSHYSQFFPASATHLLNPLLINAMWAVPFDPSGFSCCHPFRKLQLGLPSLQNLLVLPGFLSSPRFKGSSGLDQVSMSDPNYLSCQNFFFLCVCVFPLCSRLNYYSQREPFISSDTARSFLGKQLYCCVRLTQTAVICNKDKKIALVSQK